MHFFGIYEIVKHFVLVNPVVGFFPVRIANLLEGFFVDFAETHKLVQILFFVLFEVEESSPVIVVRMVSVTKLVEQVFIGGFNIVVLLLVEFVLVLVQQTRCFLEFVRLTSLFIQGNLFDSRLGIGTF